MPADAGSLMSDPLNLIEIRHDASHPTVAFRPDDFRQLETTRKVSEAVVAWIDHCCGNVSKPEELRVDCGEITHLGSEALNSLIGWNRKARSLGVRFVLTNVTPPLQDIFAITRLERMFEMGRR